jgi:hypothetical protein
MKPLNLYLIFLFIGLSATAQTNSVLLKDAGYNVLSSHSSISSAYNAIPATLTHAYTIEMTSSYNSSMETFPITFVAKNGASAINTISVVFDPSQNFGSVTSNDSTKPVFLFDGADWINLGTLGPTTWNNGLAVDYKVKNVQRSTIELINGACYNQLTQLIFYGDPSDTTGNSAIKFGSTINNSGNSNNNIRYCNMFGGRYAILSKGSTFFPNDNNTVTLNYFSSIEGVKINGGTTKMRIEKNTFQVVGTIDTSHITAITLSGFSDTTIIDGNKIYLQSAGQVKSKALAGIEIQNSADTNNFVLICNNFIYSQANSWVYATKLITYADSVPAIAGIWVNANNAVNIGAYFNTIRMQGLGAGAGTGQIHSAAFRRDGNVSPGNLTIMNNLFENSRIATSNGVHCVALCLNNSSGNIHIDYNTYTSSTGELVAYNNSVYNTISSYQAAIGTGQEVNSNDSPLIFVDQEHLAVDMINNPGLKASSISSITTDIDGDIRTYPYRGADEISVVCNGVPPPGYINAGNYGPCAIDSVYVSLAYYYYVTQNPGGHIYQWQRRAAGSTGPFTDIPNAKTLGLLLKFNASTEFRIRDSCIGGGVRYVSQIVNYERAPTVDSIIATHTGLSYNFTAAGANSVTHYKWYFENGDTSTLANPQYSFSHYGPLVKLVFWNDCGKDSLFYLIKKDTANAVRDNAIFAGSLYPNPAKTILNISLHEPVNEVAIYNLAGVKQQITIRKYAQYLQADVHNLPQAVYVLKLRTVEGKAEYLKFLKE